MFRNNDLAESQLWQIADRWVSFFSKKTYTRRADLSVKSLKESLHSHPHKIESFPIPHYRHVNLLSDSFMASDETKSAEKLHIRHILSSQSILKKRI